jgi:hypothetical protein
MAGFSVSDQIFGVANTVSFGLLSSPVSGLLGLGFKNIASSHATPFWQTLVEGGAWNQPVMTFYLSRFINASHADPEEPGGRFTMGECMHLIIFECIQSRFQGSPIKLCIRDRLSILIYPVAKKGTGFFL